jgi:cleavage and polyadenylation specificity factor subunit 1
VDAVQQFQQPETAAELRRFLGLVNFYRRFIPDGATILQPLYQLLPSKGPKHAIIQWTSDSSAAFERTKTALARTTLLHHPHPSATTAVMVDASDTAIGGVLQQFVNGTWRPLGFFSRKLQPSETRYAAFDRELLAAYASVRHFRYFLEGRLFTLYTDHRPLTFALKKPSPAHTPRQVRHLAYLSEFTSDIQHISGADNVVADALSRPLAMTTVTNTNTAVDCTTLATAQGTDDELQHLLSSPAPSSLKLRAVSIPGSDVTVMCDTTTGTPGLTYLPHCAEPSSSSYMIWRILASALHNASWPPVLCGLECTLRFAAGRAHASPANGARSTATHTLLWTHIQHQIAASTTYTST